jgi:hypothetical protein
MTEFEMALGQLPGAAVRYTPESMERLVGQTLTVHVAGGGDVLGEVTAARLDDEGQALVTIATRPDPLADQLLHDLLWGLGEFGEFSVRPSWPPPVKPVTPKPPDWNQVPQQLAPTRLEQILQPGRDETRE